MPKFDHHLHTARHSPDSILEPHELIAMAREAGLDGVVVTEHDYQWGPGELAELSRQADDLVILSGVEVSAIEGHFLVYGLPDLAGVEPGIELGALLEIVRRHDAAIVAAHPFRWGQDFDAIVREHGPAFDALELVSNNVTPETRRQTERLLDRHAMGATGSSDGHEPSVIGCYHTEFPDAIATIRDFEAALRGRRGRPRHRPGAPASGGTLTS
jgi:predicted metal-dependent phosphoesterase TrpH